MDKDFVFVHNFCKVSNLRNAMSSSGDVVDFNNGEVFYDSLNVC